MYTIEEFDKAKTKLLKYILYQKRTEYEVRNKFETTIEENMLEDIIQYLKDTNYINDKEFIEKKISEYIILKNLSIKELQYKLISKGLKKSDIEEYMSKQAEKMEQYELKSATNCIIKKIKSSEIEEIKQYLFKKGYKKSNIEKAIKNLNI